MSLILYRIFNLHFFIYLFQQFTKDKQKLNDFFKSAI